MTILITMIRRGVLAVLCAVTVAVATLEGGTLTVNGTLQCKWYKLCYLYK